MKMPAVVNFSEQPYHVELREVPVPAPDDHDVILEVAAVSVCGSDIHQWIGSHSWPVNYPVILGHEFTGVVVNVGRNVQSVLIGDRVVSETAAVIDPDSPLTRRGLYNLDPTRKGFGYGVDGAMAHFVRVPARCLHRLPADLSFEEAALTEPCCVAYNALVHNAEVHPGDCVVVLGAGPIGLLCALMANLLGAEVAIVGLDCDKKRLAVARGYGLTTFIGDASEWSRGRDRLGADGVVDAAGVSSALKTALELVRPAGWICKVGWGREPLDFSLDPLVQKNVTLRGSFSHNWPIWEKVIGLMAQRRLSVRDLIGGVWKLQQWQEAFEAMHQGEIVKAVIQPR